MTNVKRQISYIRNAIEIIDEFKNIFAIIVSTPKIKKIDINN